ncbi:MAG TPA: redox-regulated ATPase YchF [Syntrophales bacterium]|nr:redox-regulated ATPase YchF [Syntrophales bacterium]HPN08921.1 redox-regulated ATPase YchF [Syntrophales bacterium]
MGFRCGIIGLPNVGKSTIFNALTATGAEVANYPFCTIDPNIGVVSVPDPRLDFIAEILHPLKKTYTTMEFLDIAGLVKGASRGEGLGNKFLGHIREVDAIVHIVRCFDNPDVVHVDGLVDPVRDIEIVNTELLLADLETIDKRLLSVEKRVKTGDREAGQTLEFLRMIKDTLGRGIPCRNLVPTEEHTEVRKDLHLLTDKKVLYTANVSEAVLKGAQGYVSAMEEVAAREGALVITICGDMEAEIVELPPEERAVFLEDLGLRESGLEKLIRAGYDLLGLITFYTTVGTELRAWTIPRGTRANQAAGKIHSDMERGFIRAEILHFEDFKAVGNIAVAREKGLVRSEGRDYQINDGDIVVFRFNV